MSEAEPAAVGSEHQGLRAAPGQYLTFRLGGQACATPITTVREIIEFVEPSPLPQAPEWLRGVCNVRGSVVAVIDLARKLGFEDTAVHWRSCLLLVDVPTEEGGRAELAVMTDEVDRVVDYADGDLCAAPSFGTAIHADYLLGMGTVSGGVALILDLGLTLSLDELVKVERAASDFTEPADLVGEEAVAAQTESDDLL